MNNNTILRIKVPAHLYESVKEQLSLTEAKKQNYGAGYSVVKEKKARKDGMQKVEEIDYVPGSNPDIDDKTASNALSGIKKETKTRSLEELKAAMANLGKKIKQMETLAEAPREGVYDDFAKWKASFPEETEFKQENNYMLAKDAKGKELGKWNPITKSGAHADDFQYDSLEEGVLDENEALNLAADIVTWIVSHGKDAVNAIKTMDLETLEYLAGVTGISGLGAGIGTYLNKKEKETGVSQLPMTNKSRGLTEAKDKEKVERFEVIVHKNGKRVSGKDYPNRESADSAFEKASKDLENDVYLNDNIGRHLKTRKGKKEDK
jgi:hypothetical protein